MKDAPISACERSFLAKAIKQNQRLDGRQNDEFRKVNVKFGARWGSVVVVMGETKVVAEISCELSVPKATRPTEGNLLINVELRSMAALMDGARSSEMSVKINRTLERTFKDSRCVDLESLCVVAEERVWALRVDLCVLNNDGNLIDCCSIATLCALAHFKRPDVSIVEDDIVIYSAAEKEPIPIVLHHYPVCVSYCTFDDGRIAVADPTAIEERTAESQMIFGLNSLQELCCFNLGGTSLTSSHLLLQSANRASKQAKFLVQQIKEELNKDAKLRETKDFANHMRNQKINTLAEDDLSLKVRNFSLDDINESIQQKRNKVPMEFESDSDEDTAIVGNMAVALDGQSAILNSNQSDIKWIPDEQTEQDDTVNSVSSDSDDDNDVITEQKMEDVR